MMTSMCSTGCPTPGVHASWGTCQRSKNLRVLYANSAGGWDFTKQKRFDAENAAYRNAVANGIQPEAPTFAAIRHAEAVAEKG